MRYVLSVLALALLIAPVALFAQPTPASHIQLAGLEAATPAPPTPDSVEEGCRWDDQAQMWICDRSAGLSFDAFEAASAAGGYCEDYEATPCSPRFDRRIQCHYADGTFGGCECGPIEPYWICY